MNAVARSDLVAELRALLGLRGVLTGVDAVRYETGARYGAGKALCVARPATIDEVSQVVARCAAHRVRLVPQGGNTGLVGSSTPDASASQVLLSLERLRACCEIDSADRTVTVDAGVTLSELNQRLSEQGLWFPVDLGADPQVGGMIATNTGGSRMIRHGDVRHNLLAVEAVLYHPPGERVVFGRRLRKDNTGLDLKQLFVGTSGTAGIVTRAVLEVQPLPRQQATALVVPASESTVLPLLAALEARLRDFLSAFEGISGNALAAALDHVPGLSSPFGPRRPSFAVLIELASGATTAETGLDLEQALATFLEERFELLEDAVLGRGYDLWRLRHAISEGVRAIGPTIAFDISVPRSRILAFRQAARSWLAAEHPAITVFDFGHLADGGLHFNLVGKPAGATTVPQLREQLYDLVVREFGGSFSAEHGVGSHNLASWRRHTPAAAQALAGRLQDLLDPNRLCASVDFRGPAIETPAP